MQKGTMINQDTVLELILTALDDVVNYELAVILKLTSPDKLAVQKVLGPLRTTELDGYSIDLHKRKDIANLIHRTDPYLFDSTEEHLDTYYDVMDLPGDHSCLAAPLSLQGEPVGLMTLDHRTCNMFSDNIVRFIGTIAKLISIIITQTDSSLDLLKSRNRLAEERNILLSSQGGIFKEMIGESRSWNIVKEMIKTVAASELPVLIQGETGTGKEQAARMIHKLSPRNDSPFIALNCSALNSNLAESELFGHEKGAFTSAVNRRKGRFELADGGTLFLDEIGDLPVDIQPKLLRALQEGSFEPVGSEKTIYSSVRIIAASHVNINEAVETGRFREDLYYRLGVFPLTLPPVRERDEDILLLAEHFLDEVRRKNDRPNLRLRSDALALLLDYAWPGNVREIQNVILRASLVAQTGEILPEHLFINRAGEPASRENPRVSMASGASEEVTGTLDEVVAGHISKTLIRCSGRIYGSGGAAEVLGMKPTTLQSRMKKLGIFRNGRK